MSKKDYTVDDEDAGIRIDRWFKRHQPDVQHALLQKMLRKGQVKVNGRKREANYRLAEGDTITVFVQVAAAANEPENERRGPARPVNTVDFERMILFENNDYVIINKPPGLASQGGRGIDISVDDIIRGISERYKLVHRLDKDTSGVLAIAKKTSAAATFSAMLKGRGITKIYWALVRSQPERMQGQIRLPLAKRGIKMERVEVAEDGKKALTEYRIMERMPNDLTWLELSPVTGRTHQLRVHCAAIGCPIMGDGKYGGSEAFMDGVSNKLHLHARRLIIPELGIDVTAPLPPHMKELAPNV